MIINIVRIFDWKCRYGGIAVCDTIFPYDYWNSCLVLSYVRLGFASCQFNTVGRPIGIPLHGLHWNKRILKKKETRHHQPCTLLSVRNKVWFIKIESSRVYKDHFYTFIKKNILRWNDWKLCHSHCSWLKRCMLLLDFVFGEKETSALQTSFHWANKLKPKPINLKSFNFWNFNSNANRFVSFRSE